MVKLPKRFADKMSKADAYVASTIISTKIIEEYLQGSPCFFPEYTNHGILHINRVLEIADCLIPDDTFSFLTTRDISILIVSIYLHDLGMFLKKDGLREILFGSKKSNKTEYLDELTWASEWQEYIECIRRYSGKKLKKIYGDSEPITIPNETMKDLTDRDILTYGDFLRQHHHRLAYEIAVDGFPGKEVTILFENFEIEFGKNFIELIGLVARSHGMSIRQTSDFVAAFGGDDNCPLGVPVYYLMCIIRLADYLDAGRDRASHVIDNMQEKSSAISKEEWSWNQAINYGNYTWSNDIESLNIFATPKNSSQFVKIEFWLKQVQAELDLCWAILGEFYRNKYGLTIRRVTSNLTKTEGRQAFEKIFLPRDISIKANPDIAKLMIAPLYGNNPSFGIRELIQNSVDACNERDFKENQKSNTYEAKVDISIDRVNNLLIIEDNGIGMDADIIENYFLVAGSSYRRSDAWLKSFANFENESLVRRSGRFGVGFLATFLLGERVKVTTRHINDNLGYQFFVSADDDMLNIKRVNADYGTKIEIEIDAATIESLLESKEVDSDFTIPDWTGWFHYNYPVVSFYIDGEVILDRNSLIPREIDEFEGWFSIDLPDFEDVKWTDPNLERSKIYCNGIFISDMTYKFFHGDEKSNVDFPISRPTVSVVDRRGRLPINLARNEVYFLQNSELIFKDMCRYILADLLCLYIAPTWDSDLVYSNRLSGFYDSFNSEGHRRIPFQNSIIHSSAGYTLAGKPFLEGTKSSKIAVGYFSYDIKWSGSIDFDLWKSIVPLCASLTSASKSSDRFYEDHFKDDFLLPGIKIKGMSVYINKEIYNTLLLKEKLPRYFLEAISLKEEVHDYYFISTKNKYVSLIDLNVVNRVGFAQPFILEYDIEFANEEQNTKMFMTEILQEYLGQAKDYWIPYDFSERRKKFPFAFERLSNYSKRMRY